jgi:hypothetical protein
MNNLIIMRKKIKTEELGKEELSKRHLKEKLKMQRKGLSHLI